MKTLKFGIEIETVGQTREKVAKAIQSVVGGTVSHNLGAAQYDPWEVKDEKGRVWKAVTDASLSAERALQAEVVSPVLEYQDIEKLQEVVRAIRQAGAKVNQSTGIHIHVDASRFDAKAVANLVKTINKQEQLIEYALGINPSRLSRYCKSIDQDFVTKLAKRRPKTLEQINKLWYGRYNGNPAHYDSSRYRGLNLHSIFYRSTIEYRLYVQ